MQYNGDEDVMLMTVSARYYWADECLSPDESLNEPVHWLWLT